MLEENDLPKASAYFQTSLMMHQKDQSSGFSTGIHHALQAEFEQAIDLLPLPGQGAGFMQAT